MLIGLRRVWRGLLEVEGKDQFLAIEAKEAELEKEVAAAEADSKSAMPTSPWEPRMAETHAMMNPAN